MRHLLSVAVVLVLALSFPACSTVPTTRIHAAVSVPRFVDVNSYSFKEDEVTKSPIEGSVGLGYGIGWTDSGNSAGSEIYHAGVNYRSPHFAAGWTPYLGEAQVTAEGTGMFGSTLWYAFHFGGGSFWRFSFQNTYTVANEVAQNTGCTDAVGWIVGTDCTGSQTYSARAQVKVQDLGFLLTAERRLSPRSSLLFAPGVYWTNISSGNQLDTDPTNDYVLRTVFWSPSLQVGYIAHLGERFASALSIMAGAQWNKTFRPDRAVREVLPTMDVKLQF